MTFNASRAGELILALFLAPICIAAAPAKGLSTVYTFTGSSDGSDPSGVTATPDGTLYGQTYEAAENCAPSSNNDIYGCGATPTADRFGNYYGTTNGGGDLTTCKTSSAGCGVIWKYTP